MKPPSFPSFLTPRYKMTSPSTAASRLVARQVLAWKFRLAEKHFWVCAVVSLRMVQDTVRVASPPTARFITRTETEDCPDCGIRAWKLAITHNADTIRTFSGEGAPPQTFDWDFSKEARLAGQDLGKLTAPFVLHPTLTSKGGFGAAAHKAIGERHQRADLLCLCA